LFIAQKVVLYYTRFSWPSPLQWIRTTNGTRTLFIYVYILYCCFYISYIVTLYYCYISYVLFYIILLYKLCNLQYKIKHLFEKLRILFILIDWLQTLCFRKRYSEKLNRGTITLLYMNEFSIRCSLIFVVNNFLNFAILMMERRVRISLKKIWFFKKWTHYYTEYKML